MKSIQSKPPERSAAYSSRTRGHTTVFLAGSIEMGTAEDWQQMVVDAFPDGITFLNPRRDNWDPSWAQSSTNPNLVDQINWELDNLALADIIFMYFDPSTKAPISLLELGLYAESKKIIVCCPIGYWRKANVDVTCQRHGIYVHQTIESAMQSLKLRINHNVRY